MDEVTPLEEHLPHSVRLTLLQTAVRSVPELRIVETMEESISLTQPSGGNYSLTYDKYFTMLQNACIRFDKTLKHKPSPTSRVYTTMIQLMKIFIHRKKRQTSLTAAKIDEIGTTHDDIYNVHKTTSTRPPHTKPPNPRKPHDKFKSSNPKPRYSGPVYLPTHIYQMPNEDVKKALDQYNQDKKAQYKPNHIRLAKVHEQDTEGSEEEHNYPEPDLDNHLQEDSYPIQDSDIEELLEHHSPYSVNMASTYHISKHSASSS